MLGILQTQGGGHGEIQRGSGQVASIAKPLIVREATFYRGIRNTPLSEVVPPFLGTASSGGRSWLVLQDLTAGMQSPCIADLKLGTRSFEVSVSEEKKLVQLSHLANTTTASHAIRCVDICTRKCGQIIKHWDRRSGRQMSSSDLQAALLAFLPEARLPSFLRAIEQVKSKLEQTQALFPNLRLYSASVLVVYDGDSYDNTVQVFIIDFAHAYLDVVAEGGDALDCSYDDNSLKGLESLINFTSPSAVGAKGKFPPSKITSVVRSAVGCTN
jgi:hypothetical protein